MAELLKARGVPAPRTSGGILVAGEPVAAARAAAQLREQGERAVLALEESAASDADLLARATTLGLSRVAVAGPAGIRWLGGAS